MAVIDNAVISGNNGSDIVPKGYHWNFSGKSLSEVKSAGANILVAGTAILMARDYGVIIKELKMNFGDSH